MPVLLLAIGLVLVVEGLVFALAPSRLGAVALGVGLVWLAKVLGA
jgi:uncharacterized protein YjeT (DUF2065 family)